MSSKEIYPFLADVYALKLRFPVAKIAKRTGEDKVNVSAYVWGRRMAPKKFQEKFYAAFKKELADTGIRRGGNAPTENPPLQMDNTDRHMARLDRLLKVSNEINETTKRIE